MKFMCNLVGHKVEWIEPYYIVQSRFYDCGALVKDGYSLYIKTRCKRCGYEHSTSKTFECGPNVMVGKISRGWA